MVAKKDKTTLLVKLLTKSFHPFWPPLYNSPMIPSWFDGSNWACSSLLWPQWPTNLLSRTWRLTEAASSWAGKHVYFPESEVSACKMVNVLTVVPSAMCSGGVVWSLAPLSLPILKAEVAKGRWWLLCLHSMYVGGTKLCETTHLNWTVEDDLTKMSRSPKILTFGTKMTMEVIDLSLKVKILYLRMDWRKLTNYREMEKMA